MAPPSTEKHNSSFVFATIVGIFLCIVAIPVIIFNLYFIFQGFMSPDKAPSLLGKTPLIVLTESMNPVISGGDLIICDKEDVNNVKQGDIIAFFDPANSSSTTIITHRVSEVNKTGGSLEFITKGDANNTADKSSVPASKFVGIYNGTRFAGLGNFCMWLKSLPGILVCVGIPLLLLIGYDVYRRKNITKKQSEVERELRTEIENLKAEISFQ